MHRKLDPGLVEHALFQAQLRHQCWEVTTWPPTLRFELLHMKAQVKCCLPEQPNLSSKSIKVTMYKIFNNEKERV